MNRARKSIRSGKGSSKGAQVQPTTLGDGNKGRGLQKRTGLERPDAYAYAPKDTASTKGSVIKTNS